VHTPHRLCDAIASYLQAVESVLAECGQDIDAAIRRLTELKLSTEQAAAAGAVPRAEEPAQQDASHAASDRQQPEPCSSSNSAAAGPQTAEQWVDAFVQEMAGAKDFSDARCRAAKMLQAFEQFVTTRSKQVKRYRIVLQSVFCMCSTEHLGIPCAAVAGCCSAGCSRYQMRLHH